jgi:hypothetical protein
LACFSVERSKQKEVILFSSELQNVHRKRESSGRARWHDPPPIFRQRLVGSLQGINAEIKKQNTHQVFDADRHTRGSAPSRPAKTRNNARSLNRNGADSGLARMSKTRSSHQQKEESNSLTVVCFQLVKGSFVLVFFVLQM